MLRQCAVNSYAIEYGTLDAPQKPNCFNKLADQFFSTITDGRCKDRKHPGRTENRKLINYCCCNNLRYGQSLNLDLYTVVPLITAYSPYGRVSQSPFR